MVCNYCGKSFTRPSAFEVHVCTKKSRALQRNERRVRYGLHAYNRFNRLCTNQKTDSTYEQFCESPHYNSFVKFGSYVSNVRPLYPEKYIDYVVTSGLKMKDWTKDSVYEKYVTDLVFRESSEVAIERTLNHMMEWSNSNDTQWYDYFDKVNSDKLAWDIRDGKVSPWIVLNTNKGKRALAALNDSQLSQVYSVINPDIWTIRFKRNPGDVRLVQILAKEYNL